MYIATEPGMRMSDWAKQLSERSNSQSKVNKITDMTNASVGGVLDVLVTQNTVGLRTFLLHCDYGHVDHTRLPEVSLLTLNRIETLSTWQRRFHLHLSTVILIQQYGQTMNNTYIAMHISVHSVIFRYCTV
jgi:hypothetical protein